MGKPCLIDPKHIKPPKPPPPVFEPVDVFKENRLGKIFNVLGICVVIFSVYWIYKVYKERTDGVTLIPQSEFFNNPYDTYLDDIKAKSKEIPSLLPSNLVQPDNSFSAF